MIKFKRYNPLDCLTFPLIFLKAFLFVFFLCNQQIKTCKNLIRDPNWILLSENWVSAFLTTSKKKKWMNWFLFCEFNNFMCGLVLWFLIRILSGRIKIKENLKEALINFMVSWSVESSFQNNNMAITFWLK